MKDLSLVIPLLNEEESLPELYNWILRVVQKEQYSYEIFFIDDGSTDNSWNVIQKLVEKDKNIKGIKFRRNYGKSAALNTAFKQTNGFVVITMDADLQDSPDEIPSLYNMVKEDGFDLVSGWKKKRYDPVMKTIPSKFFNWVTRKISDINLHDFNCGLKAYNYEVVRNLEVYGEMHRYIPLLAKSEGFGNITEKVVSHQSRKYGNTKFGLDRFINGFLDLISLAFVRRFGKKPMHFFGLIGTLMFFVGFLFSFWLGLDKLFIHTSGRLITERPEFYIALTSMIIGSQLFLAGFLGELVSRNSVERNSYQIKEKVGL